MTRSPRRFHQDPSIFALMVATALLALTAMALMGVSASAATPCMDAAAASAAP